MDEIKKIEEQVIKDVSDYVAEHRKEVSEYAKTRTPERRGILTAKLLEYQDFKCAICGLSFASYMKPLAEAKDKIETEYTKSLYKINNGNFDDNQAGVIDDSHIKAIRARLIGELETHIAYSFRSEILKRAVANFVLDHNHKTGKVRGVLCPMCKLILFYIENKISGHKTHEIDYHGIIRDKEIAYAQHQKQIDALYDKGEQYLKKTPMASFKENKENMKWLNGISDTY